LPASMRLRHGEGKWLMKKAMEPYLPRDILYRQKMGFVTPISAWFRDALAGEATALAKSRTLGETGWFDMATIARIADEHRMGRVEHGRTLWQFVMLERSMKRMFG
jgi:asparagine synthase (glutamine-hydrolysing)